MSTQEEIVKYRRAAEQGDATAQFWLGWSYQNGNGIPQDYAEAVKWYRKAGDQGHATAQDNLGWMYQSGEGVPQSYPEAVKWHRKAAEQGDAAAQYALGSLYHLGLGVPRDYAEAINWYYKAAEQGYAYAQHNLGLIYQEGKGVPRDYAEAVKWYRKAAEQGYAYAQRNLGLIYQEGKSVEQSDVEAVKWYRKAAEQKDADAIYYLGVMYQGGKGVEQSDVEAVKWYRKAAELGHVSSQFWLGWSYQNGKGVQQSDAEAVKWFTKGAELGNADAQNWLGWMYQNGKGVSQSDVEAVKWYRKAAEQGNADAQKKLDQIKAKGIKESTVETKLTLEQGIAPTALDSDNNKSSAVGRHLRDSEACMALLEACTPKLYIHNAFRISGIPVDASTRDIKRRIDDLKAAAEMDDLHNELTHAFALNPAPGIDQIRDAVQRFQDPNHRIIDEFFWFWPYESGKSDIDPALTALRKRDENTAIKIWSEALSDNHSHKGTVAKHNLAVMYHLKALDSEQTALKNNLSVEQLLTISRDWHTSFKWWEELADNETLWSLVADRIRTIDDPRLTTGFVRRMRTTLPEALDKINAMLAIEFAECGKLLQATNHINYMKETHQGKDNISKTLSIIIKPLKVRITSAVEKATSLAEKNPTQAAKTALELLQAVLEPLTIIQTILPPEDYERIDLCDSVAEACLTCQIAYSRESEDWTTSLEILDAASKYAVSRETKERIAENRSNAAINKHLNPISNLCKTVFENAENNPYSADEEAQRIINIAPQLILNLSSSEVPNEIIINGKDQLALTLMHCAVLYGNKTDKWKPCIKILEEAIKYASSQEVKSRIEKNLSTVKNNEMLGELSPITTAPSLSTINGMGFKLFGSTDADNETGSHLSTYYFTFFFIPIFPICRYRVIPTGSGYRFLGKAPLRAFDKWHMFLSFALIALFAYYIMSGSNSKTSYRPSPSSYNTSVSSPASSYDNRSNRSALSQEINRGKAQAIQMEKRIKDMDDRLEDFERRMTAFKTTGMTEDYNILVPSYNSLISERNNLYNKYDSLIDDVNSKVKLYNK